MSVCIVASYPWERIRDQQGLSAPGVVLCSDTRVTYGGVVGPWMIAKQSLVARNILVCYTSSHVEATSIAIHRCLGTRDVKRIGQELRSAHESSGGFTEMIAIVWRAKSPPQVLEMMPPTYIPKHRTGIVGIGDGGVLDRFRSEFPADLNPPQEVEGLAQISAAWERQFGERFELPSPSLPIEDAALKIVAVLADAITMVGGPTVALPLQLMTVVRGRVEQLQATSSANLEVWDDLTTRRDRTKFALPRPARGEPWRGKRSAVQLLP